MSNLDYIILFGIPSSITSLVIYLFKKYYEKKIEITLQQKLESYKQELTIATENAKFDYQRKIQDFNLFATKKHEVYGEMNKLMLIAEGKILNLYGLRTELKYEEYNSNDFQNLMEKERFPNGKISEIIDLINQGDREKAIQNMRHFRRIKEFQDSSNSLINARNYFWASNFYFSNEVEKELKIIFDKLSALFIRQEQVFKAPESAHEIRNKLGLESIKLKEEIPPLIENSLSKMKQELSVGYYKNSE